MKQLRSLDPFSYYYLGFQHGNRWRLCSYNNNSSMDKDIIMSMRRRMVYHCFYPRVKFGLYSKIESQLSLVCSSDQDNPSSVDKVFSDQDLLTLILLRVPIKKLICIQTVSKLWFYLINNPRFSRLRESNPTPSASALFLQHNVTNYNVPNDILFVPLDQDHHHEQTIISPFRTYPFELASELYVSKLRILDSCAGLLLCASCPYLVSGSDQKYYIYNPTTNQLTTLPQRSDDYPRAAFLAFDPSKSPHYKVFICVGLISDDQRRLKQFHTYSSETGSWSPSSQPITAFTPVYSSDINYENSVYCNGRIHWITESSACFYFDLDRQRLETMPSPPIGLRFDPTRRTIHIGESQNHVYVTEIYASHNSLTVYQMKSDYSGWFLKYDVDLSPVAQVFPQMKEAAPDDVYLLSLVTKENFEEDSFLVLHIPGKAIHYNLVDRSFKGICDISFPKYRNDFLPWPKMYPRKKLIAYHFIESLSFV